ncbi:GntR family transcriptional regulator [Granulosicoccaceae sp. 1_MG-2023]|nr:GntR family transcriptional regulator [Granulosicoccaceae sp. 1_MG-2023]
MSISLSEAGGLAVASGASARFEHTFLCIRKRIALLDYEPGLRLSEDMLAEEFGVSRTPIRRVLSRLEAAGLVEVRHGAGTFVTHIPVDELREIYEFKMGLLMLMDTLSPLEPDEALTAQVYACQLACRDIPADINPRRRFAEINLTVFELLMQLVGNRSLRRAMADLFYRASRMWPFLMDESRVADEAQRFHDELAETVRVMRSPAAHTVGHLHRCHVATALLRLERFR